MIYRSVPYIALIGLLLCFWMMGCGGADPLVIDKNPRNPGPWCGPNKRVQIGMRVVGRVAWGQAKWKFFVVDNAGKEYDPEKMADQVWSYLERTGDAKKIQEAFSEGGCHPRMVIVSIKPVVVILEPCEVAALLKPPGPAPARYNSLAQIHTIAEPVYKEGLQWFSPDLKQRPTVLRFSPDGVAEIPLRSGKLKVVREGGKCKTTRE
jgi:hypothetical protein